MSEAYSKWSYDAPVMEFDRVIMERWYGSTYAVSEQKARSNLTYQCKKQINKNPGTRITLPGTIKRLA